MTTENLQKLVLVSPLSEPVLCDIDPGATPGVAAWQTHRTAR